jgi:hypothetical protein
MHRTSNHGVKGGEDSVKESRTWGEVLHAVAALDRRGCPAWAGVVVGAAGLRDAIATGRAGLSIRVFDLRRDSRREGGRRGGEACRQHKVARMGEEEVGRHRAK